MFLLSQGLEKPQKLKVEWEILEKWPLFPLLEGQRILLLKIILRWIRNLEQKRRKKKTVKDKRWLRDLVSIDQKRLLLNMKEKSRLIEKKLYKKLRVSIVMICIRVMFPGKNN